MPEHEDWRSTDLFHWLSAAGTSWTLTTWVCRDIAVANNERQLRRFNLWSGRVAEQQGAVEAL